MGACTAWLSAMLLAFAGFFLLRPASSRDALLGTYPLIASAPLPRAALVLGKWLSNVAVLSALGALLVVAAVAMQLLRGEDRTIDLAAYAVPYFALTLPTCTVIAALALAVDALPPLRGILGGIAWFSIVTALIVVPLTNTNGGTHVAPIDPFGVTALASSMFDSLHASHPAAKHIFRFTGIHWSAAIVAERAVWLPASIVLVVLAAPWVLAAPRRALGRVLRAELASAFGTAGGGMLLGSIALVVRLPRARDRSGSRAGAAPRPRRHRAAGDRCRDLRAGAGVWHVHPLAGRLHLADPRRVVSRTGQRSGRARSGGVGGRSVAGNRRSAGGHPVGARRNERPARPAPLTGG